MKREALAPSIAQGLAISMRPRTLDLRRALAWALSAFGVELRRVVVVTASAQRIEYASVEAIPDDFSFISTIETDAPPKLRIDSRLFGAELGIDVQARYPTPGGEGFVEVLSAWRDMLARLVRDGDILSAEVTRIQGNPGMLPWPPIATWAHLVVASRSRVAAAYEDPAPLFEAFDLVAEHHGHVLLSRASQAVSLASFLTVIGEPTWAQARGARPGHTRYLDAIATAEEPHDKPVLTCVGHSTPGDIVEYTAVLGDRHITAREVFALGAIRRKKSLRLGRKTVPVATVRVVFIEMTEALRERRPLTDQGVDVWAYTDGALVQLEP